MLNTKNLNEAYGLAKIQEEFLLSVERIKDLLHLSIPNLQSWKPKVKMDARFKLPLQRLSPTQMEVRRRNGLCFNCDEKFQPGHHYKSAKLFLLECLYSFQGSSSNVQLVELDESDMLL